MERPSTGVMDSGLGSPEAGAALIAADPFYQSARDIDPPRVQRALERLFPGSGDGSAALEPDLIGERHVAEVATGALVDVCLSWAGEDGDVHRQILTVLQRATQPEHGPTAGRLHCSIISSAIT
jgi:hypothetical protein